MRRDIIDASALALLSIFLALPASAADTLIGPRLARMIRAAQDAGAAPTQPAPATTPSPAPGTVAQGTNAASPRCLNCAPPFVHAWAAMEETIASGSDNTTKPTGGIYAEAPVSIGGDVKTRLDGKGLPVFDSAGNPVTYRANASTVGRVFTRLVLQPQPGASTLYDVRNYQGFEWMAGATRVLGESQGVSFSLIGAVWWGTRFSTGTDPDPLQRGHVGWGGGFKVAHVAGHRAAAVCGQDGSIGDTGAMQCRTWGKVILPKTAAVGSIYFDILASLLQPTVIGGAAAVALAPAPPATAPILHFVANIGIGINADAIFGKLTNKGAPTPPPAPPSDPATADTRYGPARPRG